MNCWGILPFLGLRALEQRAYCFLLNVGQKHSMKIAAILFAALLLASVSFSYKVQQSREEILSYYYSSIDAKIPKSAKMLVGDEKVNVYIGTDSIGIETHGGELSSFEMVPLENPGIEIWVSDYAAEAMVKKRMGVLDAIDAGGITIKTHGWYQAFKVEVIKRLYAVAKIDDIVLGKKKAGAGDLSNSAYVQRARITNCISFFC